MKEGTAKAPGESDGPVEGDDPWSKNLARFVLTAANVAILPVDGDMQVQHGVDLVVHEGRQEEFRDGHDGRPAASTLAYIMRIAIDGSVAPDFWSSSDANMTITGIHENGATITIAGMGMAGWDDRAGLQIEFVTPPQMTAHWPDEER